LALNPDELQTHHPQYFEPFVSAWRKAYPEANITSVCTPFATNKDKFSDDVFPSAYVPPSVPLGKMDTQTSATRKVEGKKKLQKYEMLSGDLNDDSDSEDDEGSEHKEKNTKDEDLDAMLRSYASSQMPNVKLFASNEERANDTNSNDDDEFIL